MTKAKNREDWVKAWRRELDCIYGMYQGRADPDLFEKMQYHIKELKDIAEKIGKKLEREGTWEKERI